MHFKSNHRPNKEIFLKTLVANCNQRKSQKINERRGRKDEIGRKIRNACYNFPGTKVEGAQKEALERIAGYIQGRSGWKKGRRRGRRLLSRSIRFIGAVQAEPDDEFSFICFHLVSEREREGDGLRSPEMLRGDLCRQERFGNTRLS